MASVSKILKHLMVTVYRTYLLLALFLAVTSVSAAIDYNLEANLNGGYTDNLFKDSSDRKDTYSIGNISLNIYPFPIGEINFTGEYTYYGDLFELSNFRYSGGITIIPTGDSSKTSLYINANFDGRKYRQESLDLTTTDFNSKDLVSLISLGREISPAFRLRTGFSFKMTGFENDEVKDKFIYEFFMGGNTALFGSNSLDLEAGYRFGNYDYVDSSTGGIRRLEPNEPYSYLTDGRIKSFYISPRFSRPLGGKTGLSITFSNRSFIDPDKEAVVFGHSTGLLSPWSSDYEGQAVLLNIKSYFVPKLIINAGAGYWNKTYLNTLEDELVVDPFFGGTVNILSTVYSEERNDEQTRFYLSIQLPIPTRSGFFIEPSLQIDYTNNTSSIEVYDYSNVSIITGVNIRL